MMGQNIGVGARGIRRVETRNKKPEIKPISGIRQHNGVSASLVRLTFVETLFIPLALRSLFEEYD
jgi:hypothetical protein